MKMVHGNAVFTREAKLAKNTHHKHFQRKTSTLSTQLTSLSTKLTTSLTARNYLLT